MRPERRRSPRGAGPSSAAMTPVTVSYPTSSSGTGTSSISGRSGSTAVHTPGHASNHLCYLVERNDTEAGHRSRRLLLSGDHVMGGSTVVISPPDGDMAQYMTSLERLLELRPADRGHRSRPRTNPRRPAGRGRGSPRAPARPRAGGHRRPPGEGRIDGRRARLRRLPRRRPREAPDRTAIDVGSPPQARRRRAGPLRASGRHRGATGPPRDS